MDAHFAWGSEHGRSWTSQLVYSGGSGYRYGLVAVGPTGVVVTRGDGSQIWFGQPAA